MADVDWSGLLQTGLDIGKNVFMGLQQQKAARKAAKAASGVGGYYGGLPLGFSSGGGMLVPQGGYGFAGPQGAPGSLQNLLGIPSDSLAGGLMNYFGGGNGGSRFPTQYTVYTTASGRQAIGGMRALGHPLLWSGDLAAARRVGRVARKLGRFTHRRPR